MEIQNSNTIQYERDNGIDILENKKNNYHGGCWNDTLSYMLVLMYMMVEQDVCL